MRRDIIQWKAPRVHTNYRGHQFRHSVNRCLAGVLVVAIAGLHVATTSATVRADDTLTLHVAPNGNDNWSGRLAEPNADQSNGPLATLRGARDAVRKLKKEKHLPAKGVTVLVHGGTYELAETFELTATDSGTETAPIVYRACDGEQVTLTGSRLITHFTPHEHGIVKADVASQGFDGIAFRQLYCNGQRQTLARYPNADPTRPHTGGYAYVDGPVPKYSWEIYKDRPDDSASLLPYRECDQRDWAHPEKGRVIIFPRYNWRNEEISIASVDRDKRTITLSRDVGFGATIRPLDRYYVRNLLEELDSRGEWYLDDEAGILYFWPPESVRKCEVRAPVLENLVTIGPKAQWITLRGFTLEHCDGSAVVVRNSEHCLIAGNTIHDTGSRCGHVPAVFVHGGHNCGVVGNDIFNICGEGIRLIGQRDKRLEPAGHYADNNYLHHIGDLFGSAAGIYLSGCSLQVSHNLIHDTNRSGIFGGGTDCVVEHNHIRHTNLETEDTGAYYNGGCWHVRGQVVRYNYIHDVFGFGRSGNKWVRPHYAWGIYLDDDHSGTHVYGNIVARTMLGGVMVHGGRDNVIENNIFIDHIKQQVTYSGHDPKSSVVASHLKAFQKAMAQPEYRERYPKLADVDENTIWQMAGNRFIRNIVSYSGPEARLYALHRNDVPQQNEWNHNLIWHFGLPLNLGLKDVPLEKQWKTWQADGFDKNSLVADPRFVAPQDDDYRLKPESPALKLEFQPIPVEKIGPYEDELRATWPIVEAEGVRECPLPNEMGPLWPGQAPVGDGTFETPNSMLTVYLPPPAEATGAAIVICPGGGYIRHVMNREGPRMARWLNEHGIAAMVLEYRLPNERSMVPLLDAQRALRTVRSRAAEWKLDPNRIGIMGFSAGGHVASTAGTHFDSGDPKAADPIDRMSCRPDFMVLVYPVVTMGEKAHTGSKARLLGEDPKPELIELFSNERQVSDQTPPAFLTHAKDDKGVPPENSRMFAAALKAHNVPVEYLELPSGGHGFDGCQGPMWEAWKTRSLQWLAEQGISSLHDK